ncbi:MAG: AbrB/MazE/SpoVT family DNA-binding domain-containing protein [Candidatus Gottesmanbacteria bacterium]|nr:AbrB/MazE/SpoVT family DNA-binding domain-containing protein [Candidatus Gottesmanbacteria bacterium]
MQQPPLEAVIRMQPKGVITIPIKMRQALNIETGTFLRLTVNHNQIIIEPLRIVPHRSTTST